MKKEITFHAKRELDELYKQSKQKKYKNKTTWEKFLNDDSTRLRKQRNKIHEYEVPLSELV